MHIWNHDSRVRVLDTYMSAEYHQFEMHMDVECHQVFPQTLRITHNLEMSYLNGASCEVFEGNSW